MDALPMSPEERYQRLEELIARLHDHTEQRSDLESLELLEEAHLLVLEEVRYAQQLTQRLRWPARVWLALSHRLRRR
jgi:hypothetical protein